MTGRGVHVVDAMLYLAGAIDQVYAQSFRLAQDFGVDDTTSMLFRFKSGATGYLGTVIASAETWRMQVFGSKGWAEVGDVEHLTTWQMKVCFLDPANITVKQKPQLMTFDNHQHGARRARAFRARHQGRPAAGGARRRRGAQCRRAGGDRRVGAQRRPRFHLNLREFHELVPSQSVVTAVLLLSCAGLSAEAQPTPGYPSKLIRIIVPSTPGGPPDQIARMVATKLTAALGQSVIVENRAGAGGMLGTAFVAKTPPDGYTVLITTASHSFIPAFTPDTPYDAVKDFAHVTMLAENFGQALVVRPTLPVKTVPELVALARQQPGKLSYGQAGLGTASHIPAEMMLSAANIEMLEVPYKGTPAAMTDLLGGHIDLFFIGTQIALPLVQEGKLRALAVTGKERWKGMPDVPTMQEQGFKDFNVVNWFGAWLPAGAPPQIVARLQTEIAKTLQEPDILKEFDTLGLRAVGSSPEEFARFVENDAETARAIARRIEGRKK